MFDFDSAFVGNDQRSLATTFLTKDVDRSVDLSEDGRFLYTINLATRDLVEIPVGDGISNAPLDYLPGDTRSIRRVPFGCIVIG